MIEQSIQASFHFGKSFKHLDACQAERWATLERQQVTHATQQVFHNRFVLLGDWGASGLSDLGVFYLCWLIWLLQGIVTFYRTIQKLTGEKS